MGFDMGYHVIIFVNLLMFINHDDLEYQNNYPLTGGNKREGVLDEYTMADAIDASKQRRHVIEIVPMGEVVLPHLHKHYCVQEGCEYQFYQWNLHTAHHSTDIEFGGHSKKEVLLEIKILCQSGKAATNWLIKNREWDQANYSKREYFGYVLSHIWNI